MDKTDDVEWKVSTGLTPYADALAAMERRAAKVRAGEERELVWLVEHPPLFTAGTSADPAELTNALGLPVFEAGRGGRYTYHGPGQRVVYLILDLEKRGRDIRCFVQALEAWMIETLARCGIAAHRSPGRIGIWVGEGPDEAKIGALGVRVKRWVTLHGFSLNVNPDLGHFSGIVPCGISEYGVTSMALLGNRSSIGDLDRALEAGFADFIADLRG